MCVTVCVISVRVVISFDAALSHVLRVVLLGMTFAGDVNCLTTVCTAAVHVDQTLVRFSLLEHSF